MPERAFIRRLLPWLLAAALPALAWTPSDPSAEARASIAAWAGAAGLPNLRAPIALDVLHRRLLDHYEANIAVLTRPYPGTLAALDTLAARGVRIAVVTNKLESLARKVIVRRANGSKANAPKGIVQNVPIVMIAVSAMKTANAIASGLPILWRSLNQRRPL